MSISGKSNENRQKTPKAERLNDHEKPLVNQYLRTVDKSVGDFFLQFSRMTDPSATKFGATAVEQVTNQIEAYPKADTPQPAPMMNTESMELAAIRQRVEQASQNA